MFFYDCEAGYVPDSGEPLITDGTIENYDLENWNEPEQDEQE